MRKLSEEIRIMIDEDGNVSIDAMNFKGKTCIEETEWLEELGAIKSDIAKPDQHVGEKLRRAEHAD